jgi:hypothetical protein
LAKTALRASRNHCLMVTRATKKAPDKPGAFL